MPGWRFGIRLLEALLEQLQLFIQGPVFQKHGVEAEFAIGSHAAGIPLLQALAGRSVRRGFAERKRREIRRLRALRYGRRPRVINLVVCKLQGYRIRGNAVG